MQPSKRISRLVRTVFTILAIAFIFHSCSKNNDEPDDDPATPSFELNFSGAMNKKVTGSYAVVQFSQDQTTTGKPIFSAIVGLSSKQGELFTVMITREEGIKTGTFPMDFTLDPFYSSSSTYTENNGATLYGAAEGTFNFKSVSATHINGTVDLELEDAGNILHITGKFNAVKP